MCGFLKQSLLLILKWTAYFSDVKVTAAPLKNAGKNLLLNGLLAGPLKQSADVHQDPSHPRVCDCLSNLCYSSLSN